MACINGYSYVKTGQNTINLNRIRDQINAVKMIYACQVYILWLRACMILHVLISFAILDEVSGGPSHRITTQILLYKIMLAVYFYMGNKVH